MTLWYGTVLCTILLLFSAAVYSRLRAAASEVFDQNLVGNLDTVRSALADEVSEVLREPGGPAPSRDEAIARAARTTLDEFQLSGVSTEIRGGRNAGRLLAAVREQGLDPSHSLLDPGVWASLVREEHGRLLETDAGVRCAAGSLVVSPGGERLVVAVAERTILLHRTLSSVRWTLLGFCGAALLLALAGGYWLAARTLAPIAALTAQASRMARSESGAPAERLAIVNASDEIGRLASTLNGLLDRIDSAVSELKVFVADAAHELKTPVAIVRAEAELALSTDRSSEAYRDSLREIAAESARLSRFVGDLTLLAEAQTLALPLERRLVDLNEILHDVHRSLKPLAVGRNVRLELDDAGAVDYRGDERLLRQVFVNLVENAIKFSPAGGRVGITVRQRSGMREVRVMDEAATLSPEDRERVFERFYRASGAREGDPSGSGLGLAIVRWAVHLHGGSVRVDPGSPRGNAFIVEFPAPAG